MVVQGVVEGQTDCYDTLYNPTRSNTQQANFLVFVVKVNNYGSSVLHYIEARLVQMNSSLHGSFKFNKSYQIRANKMTWVQHRSKPLLTTTTTDTN